MWVFLNDSFLSIVVDRTDEQRLLVRGRFAGDIQSLFPGAQVQHTPQGDYPFRASLARDEVIAAISERLRTLKYDNFKASVDDDDRHKSYFEVWSAMRRRKT